MDAVRRWIDECAGVAVDVVMTEAATRFVTPTTFQALSGRPVLTDLGVARVLAQRPFARPSPDASREVPDRDRTPDGNCTGTGVPAAPQRASTLAT